MFFEQKQCFSREDMNIYQKLGRRGSNQLVIKLIQHNAPNSRFSNHFRRSYAEFEISNSNLTRQKS